MQKFLLHTCCAPCSVAIIKELKDQYQLTVFFYNPNIYPEEEYLKRKVEVIKVCEKWKVPMVDADYEHGVWQQAIKGLEAEPEGGARCPICFKLRLEKAAKYAKDNGFDIFSTSLTSGRNKRANIINPLGLSISAKYDIPFFAADWKKASGQVKSQQLVNELSIYRQNYCGCNFSLNSNYYEKNQ